MVQDVRGQERRVRGLRQVHGNPAPDLSPTLFVDGKNALMVTEDDYERAANRALQNPVHSSAVGGLQRPSQEKETAVSPAFA